SSPPWHESLISRSADGAERLADFALWKDKAPAPLRDFITANMTAARTKTEGMLRIPDAGSAPEDWDTLYKALGRPDAPDGYGLKAPDKLPDGVAWDDAMAAQFAGVAHRIGLTPSQVSALQEFQIGHVGTQSAAAREAMQKSIEAEQAALKSAFGESLPQAAADAQRIAAEHGLPPSVFDPVSGDFWGADALKLVSSLAGRLTKLSREDRPLSSSSNPAPGGYAYAKAASTDPAHPDYEAYRRGDPTVVKRVNDGWKQMPKGG
ncbi:MAG TPA: hypothetical protein VG796_22680, partial [Verrucomicrobiales bacterium]|nr:hypothetical protein [Verrucomicrobiales bacterium]